MFEDAIARIAREVDEKIAAAIREYAERREAEAAEARRLLGLSGAAEDARYGLCRQ